MTSHTARASGVLLAVLTLLLPSFSHAQTAAAAEASAQEARPTSLPAQLDWHFTFDAGWGTFGFANSYYNNPKGTEQEDLSDQWFEGFVKPGLSAEYTRSSSSVFYGKVSVAGERTYGSAPELYGPDVSSFGPEEASIGWRSGTSLGSTENALDFVVGRVPYELGHGMLLWDGAAEGGSRGGYWTNTRKAFEFGTVGRARAGIHTIEGFYLDRDELEESDGGTRLWGANYQAGVATTSTFGFTYLHFFADGDVLPERDGLNVYNVRADSAPVATTPDLSFQFEYAAERNGALLDSNAWTVQAAYQFNSIGWTPKLSYRYAYFQGDDPDTADNEAFDPLLLGLSDWGQWFQGEIAGEYFLANSNLISHQVRAHVTPTEKIGAGVIFYDFSLDQPLTRVATVADDHVAFETDLYIDWEATANVTVSLITAFADPADAVRQLSGRTKNFSYGMVYIAYSY